MTASRESLGERGDDGVGQSLRQPPELRVTGLVVKQHHGHAHRLAVRAQ